jgi:hypothetical protein
VPTWTAEGPQPILNAGSVIPPNNPATGAVESVAVNPNNPQQIYVGSVNGGIWRTNNADPNNPGAVTWTPLTDQQASLAVGSIAFSPLDNTGNTIYAGTGSFSNLTDNGAPAGGPAIGILRSTDGGATWQNFAVNPGNEGRIKAVLPTGIDLDPGAGVQEMVLVATIDGGAGIWRSNDNGQTFTRLSGANGLPNGAVSQLIADPNNAQRFYAALPGQGVYQGNFDAGTGVITWTQVNNGIDPTNLGYIASSANIQIAAQNNGGATTLFVAFADAPVGITAVLRDVLTSTDNGANWTTIGTPGGFNAWSLGGSGMNLIADPDATNHPGVVYIGGLGGANNVFRFDPGANWVPIVGAGAQGGTAPHADSRDMAFIGSNILVETDDGGIYFIQNPTNAANNQWHSFIGETATGQALGGVEFHDIAWDSNSNIIIGGSQDNSTEIQQTTGNLVWNSIFTGDGGDVLVDNFTLAGSNQSIRYFSSQNLGNFSRQTFDANNNPVGGQVGLNTGALANFVAQFVTPIEINAIAPTAAQITAGQSTRVVIGGGGTSPVYESSDAGTGTPPTWTAVNVPTSGTTIGTVTALAYGGRLNGVDNADVLYVGDANGRVFVRTTAGGTLTATATAFPGGSVRDITLDPNDWRHAFVAGPSGVWETTDNGGTWIPRTGNLASFTSNLQTIEFAEQGNVDAILVGGLGGVFRMITNNPGVWTEYGRGTPNAVVYDLDFVADDPDNNLGNGTGVLVAGTFGRGAWEIQNASSTLTVPGVLQVSGDEDFFGEPDTIRLVLETANPSLLDVFVNGVMEGTFQLSTLQLINVFGLGGDDTLIVDSSNGLINVSSGIHFDGDGGVDGLQLLQTGGPTIKTDTYSVGPAIGSGVSTIVGQGIMVGTQTVFFENLSPVLDLVPAPSLTVIATAADNAISYSGLLSGNGFVTIDQQEPIEFANKIALTIDAGAGQDTISVNNPNTPAGLTGITIIGGDPSSGDTLNITGAGRAVTVNTALGTINGATGADLDPVSVDYDAIENLNLLAGIGDLTITTTAADDTVAVTPGLTPNGANSGTVQSSGAVPQITFVNSGTFTANLGFGNDALVVNGSSLVDTIGVTGAAVAITNRHTVNYTGVEALTVNGNAASDTFTVTPSATVAMFVDGGDPVGQLPGDVLNILAGGAPVTFNAGPGADEGSFVVGANQPVSFDHIESIGSITGGTSAAINGTNGPDAITVIARDGAYAPAVADGVQDFTASVNGGPALLFVDVPTLAINAGSGSDVVTLVAPAPNNAAWGVSVTVNGGTPATDTDQLIVQTPGAAAESVVYTPGTSDSGTLNITSSNLLVTNVTINGIDVLSYDGQGDNDTLTIVGTGGDDTIVHNPGANNQAGSFQVNSLLALNYQNLGSTGSLTVNGDTGNDTLVYNGTPADDLFTVGTSGQVTLNSRLVVNTTSVETLTLQGLLGYDTVSLAGTAGPDNISITGQTISLGNGPTINANVEDVRLDALGGNDLITYNGVSGTPENIKVSSSGVAGGGQISVPGVTLVDFTGVERIDVNGNTTEADTLTFAGTNAADRFEIDLAAAGTTDADPILQLWNGSTTPLLTLRNYTNIDTLNVQGLGGDDTFNVYTSDGTISRNLFVDGGAPSGKKKATDNLNIFYTPPRPTIIQSAATQDPDAGIVTLEYNTARFVVQYDDIEQVPSPKRLV